MPSSKQLEAIRTIPKFSYKSQTIMRNSMENGFESTNLMLPRKENKNMLHSVQIFITNFKFQKYICRDRSRLQFCNLHEYLNCVAMF